jgi:sugar lactone lactonase YvrE
MTFRYRIVSLVIVSQLVGIFVSGGLIWAEETPALKLLFSIGEAERDEPLLKPGSIDVDTLRGEVYVTDRGNSEIYVYDETGRFLQRIRKDLKVNAPDELLVDRSGNLVVCEQDLPMLWLLDHQGSVIEEVQLKLDGSERFLPGGMCTDIGGAVLVVERFGDKVVRINKTDRSIEQWPVDLGKQENIIELQDILTLGDGKTILLSSKGYAVRILDREGVLVNKFGEHGSKRNEFSFPTAFALGPKGKLWIVDTFQHSVKVFNQDGSFFKEYGRMGSKPGKFFFPNDIAFGRGGKLYILEGGNARFQVFQVEQ